MGFKSVNSRTYQPVGFRFRTLFIRVHSCPFVVEKYTLGTLCAFIRRRKTQTRRTLRCAALLPPPKTAGCRYSAPAFFAALTRSINSPGAVLPPLRVRIADESGGVAWTPEAAGIGSPRSLY